jgi:hypothetical protein
MSPAILEAVEAMRNELESSCLEVILVPQRRRTNEGGMVRVAVSKNATWYRKFCGAHLSSRKRRNNAPDTAIKRADTLRGLDELARGECRSTYARRLLEIAERRASQSSFLSMHALWSARRSA